MFIEPAEESFNLPIYRPKGELIERTHDYAIACRSLRGKINNMDVVKGFESHTTQGGHLAGEKRQGDSGNERV